MCGDDMFFRFEKATTKDNDLTHVKLSKNISYLVSFIESKRYSYRPFDSRVFFSFVRFIEDVCFRCNLSQQLCFTIVLPLLRYLIHTVYHCLTHEQ
jgi:hypothetical protein